MESFVGDALLENRHAKAKLGLTSHTGELSVRATCGGQVTGKTPLQMKIVPKIDIYPHERTAYLHPDNVQHFRVFLGNEAIAAQTNDSLVARVGYLSRKRLEVWPFREGYASIMLSDNLTYPSGFAKARLLVSDVHRLELDGGGEMSLDGEMLIYVDTFDLENERFDESEVLHMSLRFAVTKGLDRGLELERTIHNNQTVIRVRAIIPGVYAVTASLLVGKGERLLQSSPVLVRVFDRLELAPGSLLLFPGASWTV